MTPTAIKDHYQPERGVIGIMLEKAPQTPSILLQTAHPWQHEAISGKHGENLLLLDAAISSSIQVCVSGHSCSHEKNKLAPIKPWKPFAALPQTQIGKRGDANQHKPPWQWGKAILRFQCAGQNDVRGSK